MIVKNKYEFKDVFASKTLHLIEHKSRLNAYKELLSFTFVDSFQVDKSHPNGDEIHAINENGLIYVYNEKSKNLITILHARPAQLKRYYDSLSLIIPDNIADMMILNSIRNKEFNLNNK